jgi:hypothetical protein
MNVMRLVLLMMATCLSVRCSRPVEPRAQERRAPAAQRYAIESDRSRYQLRNGPFGPEATIVTTFTAPRDKGVFIMNCNGAHSVGLQRAVGETWVNAWIVEMNGCASPPIVVAAGGKHTATVTVASRAHAPIESGTYRAAWFGVLTSVDPARYSGEELPLEQRVSAPFVIDALPAPR